MYRIGQNTWSRCLSPDHSSPPSVSPQFDIVNELPLFVGLCSRRGGSSERPLTMLLKFQPASRPAGGLTTCIMYWGLADALLNSPYSSESYEIAIFSLSHTCLPLILISHLIQNRQLYMRGKIQISPLCQFSSASPASKKSAFHLPRAPPQTLTVFLFIAFHYYQGEPPFRKMRRSLRPNDKVYRRPLHGYE